MNSRHLDKHMPEAITGAMADPLRPANKGMLDRRDAERVALRAHVSYVTDERLGLSRADGLLADLSKTGCKICGPVLMAGTTVTLVLSFDDDHDPLCISGATVTWSHGDSFGVRFPALRSEDRHRLQQLILRFATLKGSSQLHTAFRLA